MSLGGKPVVVHRKTLNQKRVNSRLKRSHAKSTGTTSDLVGKRQIYDKMGEKEEGEKRDADNDK